MGDSLDRGDAVIVVKVELWPRGDQKRARNLGVAEIENDGTGTAARGNYCVRLFKFGERADGSPSRAVWREGRIEGFDRAKRGGWDLLFLALRALVGGRRNP